MDDRTTSNDIAPAEPVTLARRADFRLGSVQVQPSLRRLNGPAGSAMGEPRVIQVLAALADARGGVLSREDLLRLCWEGRTVGDDAINRAVAEARRMANAVGADFEIETVPRVGYRIKGVDWNGGPDPARADARTGRRTLLLAGAGLAGLAALGAISLLVRESRDEVDQLIARGRNLRISGRAVDLARAEALFHEAVGRDPGRADSWGLLALALRDGAAQREAAERAIAIDPAEPNARSVLAYHRRDLDDWSEWERLLLGIIADAPDCAEALGQLTFFYQGMGRCTDSLALNEQAIRVEPFNPTHQHRRAIKHWIFGRLGDADKVANRALELWPRDPHVWNARMMLYAFTNRASAGLALLDDLSRRPENLAPRSEQSWRAALAAIETPTATKIASAVEICTRAASQAPGLAAHAIMSFSHLGEIDSAFRVAQGLLEGRGELVQRASPAHVEDLYSDSAWGRTQFLFIPATAPLREDRRFPELCRRLGHARYWERRGIWPDPFVRGALVPDTHA